MLFQTNCRHWVGHKPCKENRLCPDCPAFEPLGPRILIIKLAARGDVLRTTALLAGLRKLHPDAHITWLTAPESLELLAGLPGLDHRLAWSPESLLEIQARRFELAVCLDKEPYALALMDQVRSPRKLGWGLAPDGTGTPAAANPEAEYSLALGVSDDLKFRQNQKHYLEIIFEACGLVYQGERYAFALQEQDQAAARRFFQEHNLAPGQPVAGFFTGCGPAFQHKRWTEEGFANLAVRVREELGAAVLLMAGPGEQAINQRIQSWVDAPQVAPLLDTRGQHSLRELAGFLAACRLVVTGDTLALHLALALGRPTLALFGPTCAQEITMFGLGEKLTTPADCAPCYRRTCDHDPDCMRQLSPEAVWEAFQRIWRRHDKQDRA